MDRVEFGIKLEQIEKLRDDNDYEAAAQVADTIEWRKIKRWSELSVAAEVYEKAGRLKDARNVCVYAYNRNIGGKRLVYKLTELSIAIEDFSEADDLYREFVELAPNDMERYVLLYKLNKAKKVPVERLIEILEEYKQGELDEQYEYELASLYAQAGRTQDCIKECDDLILWFNEGEYVEKALLLKSKYAKLTRTQQAKLDIMQEYRAAGVEYSSIVPEYVKEEHEADMDAVFKDRQEQETSEDADITLYETDEDGQADQAPFMVPERDYSIYDTQNIQAALAKSMEQILSGINVDDDTPAAVDTHEITAEGTDADEVGENDSFGETEEDEVSDTLNISSEEVDEPTKEIRINTHHWKDYKSVMVEKEEPEEFIPEGALPKYMVDRQETQGEADTDPMFQVVEVETVYEDEVPEKVQDETPDETPDIRPEGDGLSDEPESEPVLEPVTEPESEQLSKPDIIEGQMDIMQWLDREQAATVEENIDSEPEEKTPEECIEEAMDELTAKLMEEVASDFEEQNAAEAPSEIVSEEYADDMEEDVEEEDDENNDFVLKASQKKYLKKYLFINGIESNIAQILKAKANEEPHTTSERGNIVITGNNKTDRTGFAINLFKAMHADDERRDFQVAKTSGAIINSHGILSSLDKIKGATLIVENAGQLTKEAAEELRQLMAGETDSMLVILIGENYAINRIFAENPELEQMFEHTIEIRKYTVNELVALAKEFARGKGYIITEKALFKLFITLGQIQSDNTADSLEKTRAVVEAAIEHAGKRGKRTARRGGMIPLKEKDFI